MPNEATLVSSATECDPVLGFAMFDDDVIREYTRLRARLGLGGEPEALRIDDRYRIDDTLGRGAMGVVHLAWDERLERRVALKLVLTRRDVDPTRLEARLKREAMSLARVDHPNVVGIHDVGQHEGQTYFTMQYVAGKTLRQWQRDRSPRRSAVIEVYLRAARGLAAAHSEQVVHRDFKPDNVLVGDDGIVRVVDFGIAAALYSAPDEGLEPGFVDAGPDEAGIGGTEDAGASDAADGSDASRRLTRTGAFVGTVPYSAPEQLAGPRASQRSDQFAWCVALWEALAGRRPFAARTMSEYSAAVLEPLRPHEALPRRLRPILLRGLQPDPAQRFEDMHALIDAVERATRRSRRRWLAVAAGLVGLAALGAGWGLSNVAGGVSHESCESWVARVDSVWSPVVADALPSEPEAAAARRDALHRLDGLAGDWRASAERLCKDGHAPPPEATPRRCHEAWLNGLRRNVVLLTKHGDVRTLLGAPDLLERLVPPEGDYCALRPSPAVDPEVWSLAEAAREAAIVGDDARARSSAAASLARATKLAQVGHPLTAHLAEAHAAHAEVLAQQRQFDDAILAFERAERHAIGAQSTERLIWIRVFWAKVVALSELPGGADHLRRAEATAFAAGLADATRVRAELAEAHGTVAREQRDYEKADARHHEAQQLFEELGRPLLAARSLISIGVVEQQRGRREAAYDAYERAQAIYAQQGLPERYRNLIQVRLNLGMLGFQLSRAEGLPHLEYVMEYGTERERIEALGFAIALGVATESRAAIRAWANQGVAALRELDEDTPAALQLSLVLSTGRALAHLGDPRGEELMQAAESHASALSLADQAMSRQTWVTWLREQGLCQRAHDRLVDFDARIAGREADVPGWQTWRDELAATPCVPAATEHFTSPALETSSERNHTTPPTQDDEL